MSKDDGISASTLTAGEMQALVTRHIEAELRRDVEGTMATLCAEPEFELYPVGLRVRGRAAATEMYRRILSSPLGAAPVTHTNHGLWISSTGLITEDEAMIRMEDGSLQRLAAASRFVFEGGLIKGERAYFNTLGGDIMRKCLRADFRAMDGVEEI